MPPMTSRETIGEALYLESQCRSASARMFLSAVNLEDLDADCPPLAGAVRACLEHPARSWEFHRAICDLRRAFNVAQQLAP